MNGKQLCAVIVVSLFFSIGSAYAADTVDGRGMPPDRDGASRQQGPGKRIEAVYAQLNLSDDQKQRLDANRAEHRQKRRELAEKIRACRQELDEELMQPELNLEKINEINDRVKAVQSEQADFRLQGILSVRDILSREQFVSFLSLMKQQRHGRQGPRGPHGDRRDR